MVGMGTPIQTLPMSASHLKEVDIIGIFRYANTYPTGIKLISAGVLPSLDNMITHRLVSSLHLRCVSHTDHQIDSTASLQSKRHLSLPAKRSTKTAISCSKSLLRCKPTHRRVSVHAKTLLFVQSLRWHFYDFRDDDLDGILTRFSWVIGSGVLFDARMRYHSLLWVQAGI